MRKFFYLLLATCYAGAALAQSSLTTQPARPKPGEKITITYDPAGTPLDGKGDPTATAYLVEAFTPAAREVKLTKTGKVYTGEISTNDTTLALFLSFAADKIKDNNGKQGYYIFLYGADGNAVAGARKGIGQTGMYFGSLWGLEVDAAACNAMMKEDFAQNASLREKYKADYFSLLLQSKEENDKVLLKESLENIMKGTGATEGNYGLAKNMYTRMKDMANAAKADSLMKAVYPNGAWKKNEKLMAVSVERDAVKKEELFTAFFTDYPVKTEQDESLYSSLISSLASAWVAKGDYAKAQSYVDKIKNKSAQAGLLNSLAWKLSGESTTAKPIDAVLGKELSAQSLKLIEENANDTKGRPPYYTDEQWKDQQKQTWAMYGDTYALLLFHNKDVKGAYEYEKKAVDITKGNNVDMNESFAVYTEKVKGAKIARQELEKFVKEGKATGKMKDQLKRIYLSGNKTENQWAGYLADLQKENMLKKRAELAKEMLSDPAPGFALRDLNGNDITLASLKGKIVVVDFWATWCGPCLASFPGMKMAVEKYKNDPDVKFVFIDTRENGDRDKIKKEVTALIEKNAYPFHVLMDYDSKVIEEYKVSGIPTKFIIDKNSVVRFKKVGFGGTAEGVVEEITAMIEIAKSAEGDSRKGF